jgi:3-dehydroquinate dehydratase-2
MKVFVINGPNLNLLGIREKTIYGEQSYSDLERFIFEVCRDEDVLAEVFQSNHEGEIIEIIHRAYNEADAIVINPAAYTHTSIAIMDALKAVGLPAAEVHLSDIKSREAFRNISYAGLACIKTICGKGFEGYKEAILYLKNHIKLREG